MRRGGGRGLGRGSRSVFTVALQITGKNWRVVSCFPGCFIAAPSLSAKMPYSSLAYVTVTFVA